MARSTAACVRLRRWWLPDRATADLSAAASWRTASVALRLHPFDLDGICEQVAELRGRRLVRVPIADGLEAQAMWARGAEADYILHGAGTSPLHEVHLILHGIGHMLLGHTGHPAMMREIELAMVLPDLDESALQRLGRVVYSQVEEFQAEGFATGLLHDGDVFAGGRAPADGDVQVALRLSAVLESRRVPAFAL